MAPSSIPGREIVQVLTEIPVGVESGWHFHPGEEVGYIVAGTVEMQIRDAETLTLHAGDGFLIPPRHAAQRPRPRSGHRPDALHLHRRDRGAAGHPHGVRPSAVSASRSAAREVMPSRGNRV